jgi:hypothetical protein
MGETEKVLGGLGADYSLRYLSDNFERWMRDNMDNAPYAGHLIRLGGDARQLFQLIREHLAATYQARANGGKQTAGKPRKSGGGAPRKYATEAERQAARKASQKAWRERQK